MVWPIFKIPVAFASDVIEEIRKFKTSPQFKDITADDQLFFFFAGHGMYDKSDDGYLFLKNSLPYKPELDPAGSLNLLSYTTLIQEMRTQKFGHVLMVLDSCYGGKITDVLDGAMGFEETEIYAMQGGISDADKRAILRSMTNKSRFALCSSEDEAPDGQRGKGSPFANRLRETLLEKSKVKGFAEFFSIYGDLQNLPSGPRWANFPGSSVNGGFVFVKKGKL